MKRSVSRHLLVALTLAMTVGLTACGPEENNDGNAATNSGGNNGDDNNGEGNNGPGDNPFAGDAAAAMEGEMLFRGPEGGCTGCHNADDGTAILDSAQNFNESTRTDQEQFLIIKNGSDTNPAMMAYGDTYTDEEIWKLVTFVNTFE